MSAEAKYYIGLIIMIFTLLSTIGGYFYYLRQAKRVIEAPESIPEVAAEIVEDKYVDPIIKKAETLIKVIKFVASLPPIVIVMLVIAYAMLKK